MTVELERPFAWPERPDDLSPWNAEEHKMAGEEQQRLGARLGMQADQQGVSDERRTSMREQAKALSQLVSTFRFEAQQARPALKSVARPALGMREAA